MGFWDKAFDVAKNVGTAAMSAIEESANETREIKLKCEGKSDDELLRMIHSDGFFSSSSKEKAIAFSTLKSRGYSAEDINAAKR